jgi:hypothetical protein
MYWDGVFKQMLVGYMTGATDMTLLDGTTFNANKYIDFIVFVKKRN